MALIFFPIAQTVQKLLQFYYENNLSGFIFECESETANVNVEPIISSCVGLVSNNLLSPVQHKHQYC